MEDTPNTNSSDTELDRSSHHWRKRVPWNNINTQPNQGHRRKGGCRKHKTKTRHHNITNAENHRQDIKPHHKTNAGPATTKKLWRIAPPPYTPPNSTLSRGRNHHLSFRQNPNTTTSTTT
ncbi:hypothetical protein L195_g061285, partial [Trifolium pratense]